jgi:hypothetical protein
MQVTNNILLFFKESLFQQKKNIKKRLTNGWKMLFEKRNKSLVFLLLDNL